MSHKKDDQVFWTTMPGILTGLAAVLTATGGLIAALSAAGILWVPTPTPTSSSTIPPTAPVPTMITPTAMLTQSVLPASSPTATVGPTNTATPTPSPTPSATPTACSVPTSPHLQDARPKIASWGCPGNAEQPVNNYAIQQFQHGWMLEPFLDRRTIYVLFDSSKKTWKQFQENWEQGERADSCPAILEPPGNFKKPQYGLGQVWCGASADGGLKPEERQTLGFGTNAGFGPSYIPSALYYQDFGANGIIFGGTLSNAQYQYVSCRPGAMMIFILSKDGISWDMVGGPC